MNLYVTTATTVSPLLLAAYNRGIERARRVGREEQARREGWCRACGADRDGHHATCQACRKAAQG